MMHLSQGVGSAAASRQAWQYCCKQCMWFRQLFLQMQSVLHSRRIRLSYDSAQAQ